MKKVIKISKVVALAILWPAKKYIKMTAKGYEALLGDNIKYFNPCI